MKPTPHSNVQAAAKVPTRRVQTGLALLGCIVALVWLTSGCGTPPTPPPAGFDTTPGTASYSTNLLQEGDVVSITFQYSTNFNVVQKITLDGMLNLEGIGQVKAAGSSTPALQEKVAQLYKPQTKDDVVTVKQVAAVSGVYVVGAVFRPGKVVMERPMTVVEAVVEAGGFDPNRANLTKVTVLRVTDGKQRTHTVNLRDALQGREENPFYLRPFDVVHVPMKRFNF